MKQMTFSHASIIAIIVTAYALPALSQTAPPPARRSILASVSNPLLADFNDILFVERSTRADITGSEYDGDHMCNQYHAFNARKGGGLYILKNFKSASPQLFNVVGDLTVPTGTNKGTRLRDGAFLSPDLSYDGKTILFAWAPGDSLPAWAQANRFSIFKIDIDGANLQRLTDANFDDFDPAWLPNGRIVFISNRRGGFGRCHPMPKPTFTLYSMKADGSDLYCISFHETNEWQPSVDNDGKIVYTRWDYLDRDSDIAHHIWVCMPDGTNPRSWHGNYPYPWCELPEGLTYNLFSGDGRHVRPWIEMNIRAIPNTTGKYVATASLHHGQAFGSLVLIDVSKKDDNRLSQITRLTPDVPFPEAETGTEQSWEKYGTAWPFSEQQFLCNYTNGIYFLDCAAKTMDTIYVSKSLGFRPIDPIPVFARRKPPALSTATCQGELLKPNSPNATITIINVKIADIPIPDSIPIKYMRIVMVFPKSTPNQDTPKVNYGSQSLCRMSLGAVPVERDGSVYCKAPVGKEIYFQLLDSNFQAVQSMRSGTYVHPGEQLSCLGCHEDKGTAPPASRPLAILRDPSPITPEPPGLEPACYYRTVKPVFDAKCAPCHAQTGKGPSMEYNSLEPYAYYFTGGNGAIDTADHGGSRTIPGLFGARYSRIIKEGHLTSAHHNVSLTDSEIHRITLWLDLNSNELGAYLNVSAQQKGKLVWPDIDADSTNPQGVENRAVTAIAFQPRTVRKGASKEILAGNTIDLPTDGIWRILVFDMNGKVIDRVSLMGPSRYRIPFSCRTRGIYLVSTVHDHVTSTRLFVVK